MDQDKVLLTGAWARTATWDRCYGSVSGSSRGTIDTPSRGGCVRADEVDPFADLWRRLDVVDPNSREHPGGGRGGGRLTVADPGSAVTMRGLQSANPIGQYPIDQ